MQRILKFVICFLCAITGLSSSSYGRPAESLIVSFVTAHLNFIPESVQGVLVTPDGELITTGAMGPFGYEKIVVEEPKSGSYLVYYQALVNLKPKYCTIVGGIEANLCSQPMTLIPFFPTDSRIQSFSQTKAIKIGDKTSPIGLFQIH